MIVIGVVVVRSWWRSSRVSVVCVWHTHYAHSWWPSSLLCKQRWAPVTTTTADVSTSASTAMAQRSASVTTATRSLTIRPAVKVVGYRIRRTHENVGLLCTLIAGSDIQIIEWEWYKSTPLYIFACKLWQMNDSTIFQMIFWHIINHINQQNDPDRVNFITFCWLLFARWRYKAEWAL